MVIELEVHQDQEGVLNVANSVMLPRLEAHPWSWQSSRMSISPLMKMLLQVSVHWWKNLREKVKIRPKWNARSARQTSQRFYTLWNTEDYIQESNLWPVPIVNLTLLKNLWWELISCENTRVSSKEQQGLVSLCMMAQRIPTPALFVHLKMSHFHPRRMPKSISKSMESP